MRLPTVDDHGLECKLCVAIFLTITGILLWSFSETLLFKQEHLLKKSRAIYTFSITWTSNLLWGNSKQLLAIKLKIQNSFHLLSSKLSIFLYVTHVRFRQQRSLQYAGRMSIVNLVSDRVLHESLRTSVNRPPARCPGGHRFESSRGLKILFLSPHASVMLITVPSFHKAKIVLIMRVH